MYETLIDDIRAALGQHGGAMDPASAHALLRGLHPSDVAFILDELTLPEAERVFGLIDDDCAAEALTQVAPATRRHLLQTASSARTANLLRRLPMDEVAEVVSEAGSDAGRVLALMP